LRQREAPPYIFLLAYTDESLSRSFPFNATKRQHAPLSIVNFSAVVSEVELGKISMKALFTNMLINSNYSAVQTAEITFNRVGVHVIPDIYIITMVDYTMEENSFPDRPTPYLFAFSSTTSR
jgi:hypothetical protein